MISSYTFTRPLTSAGKATRYLSVLSLLNKVGPISKYEILRDVWGIKNAVFDKCIYRGHMSDLFSAMRGYGIVVYSHKTKKWAITPKGSNLLESVKLEWGKRYAESYWD